MPQKKKVGKKEEVGIMQRVINKLKSGRPGAVAARANPDQKGMSASQKRRVKQFKEGFTRTGRKYKK